MWPLRSFHVLLFSMFFQEYAILNPPVSPLKPCYSPLFYGHAKIYRPYLCLPHPHSNQYYHSVWFPHQPAHNLCHTLHERDTSICYRNYVMQLLASLPTLDNTPPHSLCTPSYPVSVSYIQPPSGQAANQANSNSGFLVHFNQQCYNTPPSNFAQAKSGQSFYYH